MNIDEFRLSEARRAALAELLRNPVFQQASQAVLMSCIPSGATRPPEPGLHPDTALAHHHHRLAGRAEALALLEKMTRPKPADEDVPEEEFTSTLKEYLKLDHNAQ